MFSAEILLQLFSKISFLSWYFKIVILFILLLVKLYDFLKYEFRFTSLSLYPYLSIYPSFYLSIHSLSIYLHNHNIDDKIIYHTQTGKKIVIKMKDKTHIHVKLSMSIFLIIYNMYIKVVCIWKKVKTSIQHITKYVYPWVYFWSDMNLPVK